MEPDNRGIGPAISVVLMVGIVVILVAVLSVALFDFTSSLDEPAPTVGETTGEFEAGGDIDEQNVKITNLAGDGVDIEEIEIIVRASRPDDEDLGVRLVDLPGNGTNSFTIADENIQGEDDLIDQGIHQPSRLIVVDDPNVWATGTTIQFRIAVQEADFRDPPGSTNPAANELEVVLVHTPSDTILFEDTFTG